MPVTHATYRRLMRRILRAHETARDPECKPVRDVLELAMITTEQLVPPILDEAPAFRI